MKVLVLGSAGQIGSALTDYLRVHGHEVTEFDNATFAPNDLRIPHILDTLLPFIDFVFFLAYDVGGAIYLRRYQNEHAFMSNNARIMDNTFSSLRRFNVPFIFASSQMSGMSHSTYGILKLLGERYTLDSNGKIAKFWNVYGPEKDGEKAHVITDFIAMAEKGGIQMRTTGEEMRQFLYVDDCCECLTTLMNGFGLIPQRQFDISSFEWVRIRDIANIIARQFKCKVTAGLGTDDLQRAELNEPDRDILKYWIPTTKLRDGINYCIDARHNSHNNGM